MSDSNTRPLAQKYRKKPIVIEAMQIVNGGGVDNRDDVLRWMGTDLASNSLAPAYSALGGGIVMLTLEGEMDADPGDWIIKSVKGEFRPCKPDIFEATYEVAE